MNFELFFVFKRICSIQHLVPKTGIEDEEKRTRMNDLHNVEGKKKKILERSGFRVHVRKVVAIAHA